MLAGRASALWEPECSAGRAPGMRWRSGARLIGLGAGGLAAGRAVLRAVVFALPVLREIGRLPLPDALAGPLPFFFAMARSVACPVASHFHIEHAIYSSPISLAESPRESRHKGDYMAVHF